MRVPWPTSLPSTYQQRTAQLRPASFLPSLSLIQKRRLSDSSSSSDSPSSNAPLNPSHNPSVSSSHNHNRYYGKSRAPPPYGRSHVVSRHRTSSFRIPNPVVPHFPQRVTLADGSTFVHWTTSPRPRIELTRDTTNHPVWNAWALAAQEGGLGMGVGVGAEAVGGENSEEQQHQAAKAKAKAKAQARAEAATVNRMARFRRKFAEMDESGSTGIDMQWLEEAGGEAKDKKNENGDTTNRSVMTASSYANSGYREPEKKTKGGNKRR